MFQNILNIQSVSISLAYVSEHSEQNEIAETFYENYNR